MLVAQLRHEVDLPGCSFSQLLNKTEKQGHVQQYLRGIIIPKLKEMVSKNKLGDSLYKVKPEKYGSSAEL